MNIGRHLLVLPRNGTLEFWHWLSDFNEAVVGYIVIFRLLGAVSPRSTGQIPQNQFYTLMVKLKIIFIRHDVM